VVVTRAGRAVLDRVRTALLADDDLVAAAQSVRDPESGTFHVGVIPTVAPYVLPDVAPALRARFPRARCALPPYALSGAIARHDHRADDDYHSQPGALYRLMNDAQKKLLTDNIVRAMKSVPDFIQPRQIAHFKKADPDYGARVEKGLRSADEGRSPADPGREVRQRAAAAAA
jgi:hypothetical protein